MKRLNSIEKALVLAILERVESAMEKDVVDCRTVYTDGGRITLMLDEHLMTSLKKIVGKNERKTQR